MLSSNSNLRPARVLVILFLFILLSTISAFKSETMEFIKSLFDSGLLFYFVWIYVIVSVLSHTFYSGNFTRINFERTTELLFSIATFGLAGTTSITLLQGVFMQYFYNIKYFYNFGNLDIGSVGIVSVYLLVYCGVETSKLLGDVIFQAQGADAEPEPEEDSQS